MWQAILSLGGLGILASLSLGIASKKFAVEVDPTVEAILDALPGANCGACGFPGCSGMSEAMAKGDEEATKTQLQRWRRNNSAFLHAWAQQYAEHLENLAS